MERRRLKALFVVAAAFAVAAPTASSHSASRCFPKGSTTIRHDAVARVYRVPDTNFDGSDDVLACAYRGGEPYLLGLTQPVLRSGTAIPHVRLSGLFVAWHSEAYTASGDLTADVQVADLRTDKLLAEWSPGLQLCLGANTSDVEALRVSDRGSAAWVASVGPDCINEFQVWTFARHRGVRLRASSRTIIPRSLRLFRRRVTWRDGVVTKTAPL